MTRHAFEDWPKRTKSGGGFTEAEKGIIRQAARHGRLPREVAKELHCSTRTINDYYAKFRAEWHVPERSKRAPLPDRFYRSNFEAS